VSDLLVQVRKRRWPKRRLAARWSTGPQPTERANFPLKTLTALRSTSIGPL